MIHKLFFISGIILLIIAAVIHHRHDYGVMHCLHHQWRHKKFSDFMIKHLSRKLNLNQEQQSKLRTIRDDLAVKRDSMHLEHEIHYQWLIHELEKDTLNKDQLQAMFKQKIDRMQEMHPVVINQLAEFHAMLSADQKRKLIEMIWKHHKRMSP